MSLDRASSERADRIAGAIFGAAIGDALGSAFEMLPHDEIARHLKGSCVSDFEPALRGSLLYRREPGEPTDDTAMALSVSYALASGGPLDADAFARAFLSDLAPVQGRFATMFWNGGPGGATTRALRSLHLGARAETNGHPDDGGNGAAMRAHPVGCLASRDDVLRVAAIQARVTHGHPSAVAAAQAVAVLVFDAIAGRAATTEVPQGIDDPAFATAWADAHRDLVLGVRLPAHLTNVAMSGWVTVASAHAIALMCGEDPERAIGFAAASGGDTDTVASIVGALVGARHGRSALPHRWITGLAPGIGDLCTDAARRLVEATTRVAAPSTPPSRSGDW